MVGGGGGGVVSEPRWGLEMGSRQVTGHDPGSSCYCNNMYTYNHVLHSASNNGIIIIVLNTAIYLQPAPLNSQPPWSYIAFLYKVVAIRMTVHPRVG